MISLSKMMLQVLTETMSFADLLNNSDPARVDRATHVKSRSLKVTTMDGQEAWIFSYKSDPDWTTTEKRWQGYVQFLKEAVGPNDNAEDLQCMVDCNCQDYRYRWLIEMPKLVRGKLVQIRGMEIMGTLRKIQAMIWELDYVSI